MKMLGQVWRLCEVVRQPSSFLALSKQFVEKSTSKQFTENELKRLVYFGAKLVNSFHAEFFHNMLFFWWTFGDPLCSNFSCQVCILPPGKKQQVERTTPSNDVSCTRSPHCIPVDRTVAGPYHKRSWHKWSLFQESKKGSTSGHMMRNHCCLNFGCSFSA